MLIQATTWINLKTKTEEKKIPDTKEYILHDSINMKSKNSKAYYVDHVGGREGVLTGKGYEENYLRG